MNSDHSLISNIDSHWNLHAQILGILFWGRSTYRFHCCSFGTFNHYLSLLGENFIALGWNVAISHYGILSCSCRNLDSSIWSVNLQSVIHTSAGLFFLDYWCFELQQNGTKVNVLNLALIDSFSWRIDRFRFPVWSYGAYFWSILCSTWNGFEPVLQESVAGSCFIHWCLEYTEPRIWFLPRCLPEARLCAGKELAL